MDKKEVKIEEEELNIALSFWQKFYSNRTEITWDEFARAMQELLQ